MICFLHLLLYRVAGPHLPKAFTPRHANPSNDEIPNAAYERTRYRTSDTTIDTI